MASTSDIPSLLSSLSAAQSATIPALHAVLHAFSTELSALRSRVDALHTLHHKLDARLSALVPAPTNPANPPSPRPVPPIPDSLDDLTQPPNPPQPPPTNIPSPPLSPTTPAAPNPRPLPLLAQWPPCGLPPPPPRPTASRNDAHQSPPPPTPPPPSANLATRSSPRATTSRPGTTSNAKTFSTPSSAPPETTPRASSKPQPRASSVRRAAHSSPSPSTLPPKTPRPSSRAASDSNVSSRLKRPRRRSKRSALPLRVLYSDDEENDSPKTGRNPGKKARPAPAPGKAERRPLGERTNRQRGAPPPATPNLEGFRSPAGAAKAAAALQKAVLERNTPRCKEVVRGEGRAALQAAACPECETFLRKEAEGRDDPEKAFQEMVKKACRHRQRFLAPETPEEYWKLTFDETQTQPPRPPTGRKR